MTDARYICITDAICSCQSVIYVFWAVNIVWYRTSAKGSPQNPGYIENVKMNGEIFEASTLQKLLEKNPQQLS